MPAPSRTEVDRRKRQFHQGPPTSTASPNCRATERSPLPLPTTPATRPYQVILRGLDGRYALGLYATDNVGNTTLTGIQNTVFTAVDAVPAITATAFAPTLTKSDTVATVTFNVPLAVLP